MQLWCLAPLKKFIDCYCASGWNICIDSRGEYHTGDQIGKISIGSTDTNATVLEQKTESLHKK